MLFLWSIHWISCFALKFIKLQLFEIVNPQHLILLIFIFKFTKTWLSWWFYYTRRRIFSWHWCKGSQFNSLVHRVVFFFHYGFLCFTVIFSDHLFFVCLIINCSVSLIQELCIANWICTTSRYCRWKDSSCCKHWFSPLSIIIFAYLKAILLPWFK